jgi:hypothetical protein
MHKLTTNPKRYYIKLMLNGGTIMKHRILTALLLPLAALSFVVGSATPAAAIYTTCPWGTFCAWNDTNARGTKWVYYFSEQNPPGWCNPLPTNHDDWWTSVQNTYGGNSTTKYRVRYFTAAHCSTSTYYDQISSPDFTNLPSAANNRVSSFMILRQP